MNNAVGRQTLQHIAAIGAGEDHATERLDWRAAAIPQQRGDGADAVSGRQHDGVGGVEGDKNPPPGPLPPPPTPDFSQ